MDTELATTVETKGISDETCQVLEEEGIVSPLQFSRPSEKNILGDCSQNLKLGSMLY